MPHRLPHALSRRFVVMGPLLLAAATAACAAKPRVDAPPRSVIFFSNLSASIDPDGENVVREISADALAYPTRSILIEGFADPQAGAPGTIRTLSQLRAQAVADALVAHGIARSRLTIRPRGATGGDPGIESRRVDVSFST